jgi:predicted dehydrogenase
MKIGIVGAGFMGRVHAAAWENTPAEVAGITSATRASAEKIAALYPTANVYDSLEAMLKQVDVVDICTPTHLHHAQVLLAAAAGRHVVCEKPLARHIYQTQEMIAACQRANVHLLVAHVLRFFPEYAGAKAVVDRGEIGKVAVTRLTRCSFKPARSNPDAWFHNFEQSGGMMLDLMIHDFDYARWIAGEVQSVFAKNITTNFPDAPGDYALVILKHASGALSHIEGGWSYPAPMFRTSLEIAGSQGLIEHPAGSSVPIGIHLHQAQSDDADIAVPASPMLEDPYTTQAQHFYDVLTGQKPPRVTAQDGAAALQIALAAIESARTGRHVLVKEVA